MKCNNKSILLKDSPYIFFQIIWAGFYIRPFRICFNYFVQAVSLVLRDSNAISTQKTSSYSAETADLFTKKQILRQVPQSYEISDFTNQIILRSALTNVLKQLSSSGSRRFKRAHRTHTGTQILSSQARLGFPLSPVLNFSGGLMMYTVVRVVVQGSFSAADVHT